MLTKLCCQLRDWLIACVEDALYTSICYIFLAYRGLSTIIRRMAPDTSMKAVAAPLAPTETPVETIERKTKCWLTIERSLTDANFANCNPQSQSKLYQLPKELRDLTFEYACTQSQDPRHKYRETAFYYRPGHTSRLKTHTSLLLTCRRVWLEANSLPMQQAEHCFWFQRGPYDPKGDGGWALNLRHERDRFSRFLRSLTMSNLQNLTYIHLFMQMFQALEFCQDGRLGLFFPDYYTQRGLRPKVFHVTIRQSDWWNWESDEQLSFTEGWVRFILRELQASGVEEFKLELETLVSKKGQLDPIVERLRGLEGKPAFIDPNDPESGEAPSFVINGPPQTWHWSRSPRLDDKDWPVFKDLSKLELLVTILTWKNRHPISNRQLTSQPLPPVRTQSSPWPLPFNTTPARSPSMILRNRSRRAMMSEVKWNVPTSFPWHADAMRWDSDEKARKVEDLRRQRFDRMLGDMEAEKLKLEWTACGSLLKFGGIAP